MPSYAWNHNETPARRHTLPAIAQGYSLGADPEHWPANVYPPGPDDTCPAGARVVSASRVVRNGKSVVALVTAKVDPVADALAAEAAKPADLKAAEAELAAAPAKPATVAEHIAAISARLAVIEARLRGRP
jgi:hypothetical protein